MSKKVKMIITSIIVVTVLFLSVTMIISKKSVFSENENRYLEKMPKFSFESLISGKYMTKLSNYLSDHFPWRDFFMNFKTSNQKLIGQKIINDVYIGSDGYLLERYRKGNNIEKISNALNSFNDSINYVNMEIILAPTSTSINASKLPKGALNDSEKLDIDNYYNRIRFNKINVYDALIEGNKSYQMFYKSDHHWTSYGAYYAYLEYCKSNSIDPVFIQNYTINEVTDSFKGTLYSKVSDYNSSSDSINLFVPKESDYQVNYVVKEKTTNTLYELDYLEKKDKYSLFLDNNHPLIEITNNRISNGKELLVIKDSFANTLIPFLVQHYSKVHVIDPRYYTLSISDYVINNKKIMDVLFVYNIGTLDDDMGIISIK